MYLETIKIIDGNAQHLKYHQQRVNDTLLTSDAFLLTELIKLAPSKGTFRCRIIYSHTAYSIEFIPYTLKVPKHFHLVNDPGLDYRYKFSDRTSLECVKCGFEEIILVRDSLLTDTSIANIALYDSKQWYTPRLPLLRGTTRARLLDEGQIKEKDIAVTELHDYEKIALLNAMVGFKEVEDAIILANNRVEKIFRASRGRIE